MGKEMEKGRKKRKVKRSNRRKRARETSASPVSDSVKTEQPKEGGGKGHTEREENSFGDVSFNLAWAWSSNWGNGGRGEGVKIGTVNRSRVPLNASLPLNKTKEAPQLFVINRGAKRWGVVDHRSSEPGAGRSVAATPFRGRAGGRRLVQELGGRWKVRRATNLGEGRGVRRSKSGRGGERGRGNIEQKAWKLRTARQ